MDQTPADPCPGRGPVILLVDDNAPMRALIRSMVEDIASIVHECDDGRSALDAYPRVRPDWVLMDIEMSGMDGIEATRAIRSLDAAARVVIVTGHDDERYRRAAEQAGATGFVAKENLLDLAALLADAPPADDGGR